MNKELKPSPPVRVIADTTRRCNLKCWYCHSTSGPNYKGPELTGENIRDIFEASENNCVFDVTLTGGEPTMWPGLNKAIEASHSLSYTSAQLITNATVLSQQKIDILKDGNFKRICVSLDGLAETHEQNRGGGTYARTLKGIAELRNVVDNLTVISVLDSTNYKKWPELTSMLYDIGVKQHHLAPVCFAGNAMDDYRGLSEQQFKEVRDTVDEIKARFPSEFTLMFNDVLISGPESRTMSLQTFTEFAKGWHVVVRPNGKVNTSVRAWGRSWRQDEELGDINSQGMAQVLNVYKERRRMIASSRFEPNEERGKKFHLGQITDQQIIVDIGNVKSVESGETVVYEGTTAVKEGGVAEILNMDNRESLGLLTQDVTQDPSRFRLRIEDDFGFLFNTVTFNITVLNLSEAKEFKRIII